MVNNCTETVHGDRQFYISETSNQIDKLLVVLVNTLEVFDDDDKKVEYTQKDSVQFLAEFARLQVQTQTKYYMFICCLWLGAFFVCMTISVEISAESDSIASFKKSKWLNNDQESNWSRLESEINRSPNKQALFQDELEEEEES